MSSLSDHVLEFEDMPLKKSTKPKKEIKKMSENSKPATTKKGKMPVKEPRSIKLSTIWKVAVYTFAVIGVILSVMYVNEIVNNVVDARAELKAQQLIEAQQTAAPQSKANQ